jgi:hypothetical protein
MRAVVAAHIAQHGNTCPGFDRAAHPSNDLTADHLVPRSRGGIGGPLRVLCRSCNARRGATGDNGGEIFNERRCMADPANQWRIYTRRRP